MRYYRFLARIQLDLLTIPLAEWSEQEVIDNYLKPTGFDYLSKIFMEQHVTGAVLMVLEVSRGASFDLVYSTLIVNRRDISRK